VKCKFCNTSIRTTNYITSYLICCPNCNKIFSTKPNNKCYIKIYDPSTSIVSHKDHDFNIKDKIICIDPQHRLFLDFGEIINMEKLFVRVLFHNRHKVWMPYQIIQRMPKEWIT
jgi:ribosome-binding protein aMBF1 (putative translation factor)